MRIIIKGKNLKLNEDLKSYAFEKVAKFAEIIEDPAVCEVVLSDELGPKGGVDKAVHITLTLPGEKNAVHIEKTTSDFFGSIDLAQEKLEREILKYKEKTKIGPRYPTKYHEAKVVEEANQEL